MLKPIAVGDLMTRNLATVNPSTDLKNCARQMVKQRVNTILITDRTRLIGILTARDILWSIIKKPDLNLKKIKVSDIASRKVAVIKPSADIGQAFKKMKKFGFRRLPVLSKGKLVGILTLKDILRVEPNLYQEVGALLRIREEEQKVKKIIKTEDTETEGYCDECNSYEMLLKVEGRPLCPDCRDALY